VDKANDAAESDAPPPPPPPPPQGTSRSRVTNGTVTSPMLKPFSNSLLKPGDSSITMTGQAASTVTLSHMVPPSSSSKSGLPLAAPSLSNSRSPLQSTALGNMLASVKNPQQMNIDLKAQLAAIKGESNSNPRYLSL